MLLRKLGVKLVVLKGGRSKEECDAFFASSYSKGIWVDVERCFSDKKNDPTPLHALNRIAQVHAYYTNLMPLPWIDEWTATVKREKWPLRDFADMYLIHNQAAPRRRNGPVVVVITNKRNLLVDGTNRINELNSVGGIGFVDVLAITLHEPVITRSQWKDD